MVRYLSSYVGIIIIIIHKFIMNNYTFHFVCVWVFLQVGQAKESFEEVSLLLGWKYIFLRFIFFFLHLLYFWSFHKISETSYATKLYCNRLCWGIVWNCLLGKLTHSVDYVICLNHSFPEITPEF